MPILFFRLIVGVTLVAFLGGCGPRSDTFVGGDVRGSAPRIDQFNSGFSDPPTSISAPNLEFPIPYRIHVVDADGDMDFLKITVRYDDCQGITRSRSFQVLLSVAERVKTELFLDSVTTERMQVPLDCPATENAFSISGRMHDQLGNPSVNTIENLLVIGASQGGL